MEIQKQIGARIKELRTKLGVTQEEMAHRAGIDKTYWNEVENGKRNVGVKNLAKILRALRTSFSDFFDAKRFNK